MSTIATTTVTTPHEGQHRPTRHRPTRHRPTRHRPTRHRPTRLGGVVALLGGFVIALAALLAGPAVGHAQTAPSVSASPDPAVAGSTVVVSGTGFQPGEQVDVDFAGDRVSTLADATGAYSVSLVVDASVPAGSHPLDAMGDQGSWAGGDLTVTATVPVVTNPPTTSPPVAAPAPATATPTVSASPDPAAAGSTVTVSGGGFQPGERVDVDFAGARVRTVADGSGNVSVLLTVDSMVPAGAHPLDATGDQGSWAGSDLTVAATTPVVTSRPAPNAPPATQAPAPQAPTASQAPAPLTPVTAVPPHGPTAETSSDAARADATEGDRATDIAGDAGTQTGTGTETGTETGSSVGDAAVDDGGSTLESSRDGSAEPGEQAVGPATDDPQPTESNAAALPDTTEASNGSIGWLLPIVLIVGGAGVLVAVLAADRARRGSEPVPEAELV